MGGQRKLAQTQAIKRRIRSVKNTNQITKAMELVAASKLRKAQEATLRTRTYYNGAREILSRLAQLVAARKYEYFKARKTITSRLYVIVTSDRGLAGAYNTNVLKQFAIELEENQKTGIKTEVITLGRKGAQVIARTQGVELIGAYQDIAAQPHPADIEPILHTVREHFLNKSVQEVVVFYTHFHSSIVQTPTRKRLLPVDIDEEFVAVHGDIANAEFEPSPMAVLKYVVPKLVAAEFYQTILESSASEHSMRMLAMKNASDNASDLIDDLTLEYNSARQASITQELAEITGGAAAIS